MKPPLQISRAANGEYHLVDPDTRLDAYGAYTVDEYQPHGALTHAPTQEGMDRISAILGEMPDALFGQMLADATSE